ncbi:MAG: bifunctional DNA-formamidopyrimidine glycosylase/DNA-(apurinic or apyrimidinic site) lyase [Myxococcota bacterium]
MPELPEVETVRRTLAVHLRGRRILSTEIRDARLRWPVDVARVEGAVRDAGIAGLRRRAKYLQVDLSTGEVVLLHLGMSGRFRIGSGDEPLALHDHVRFVLDDGRELRLNDPRRFGSVDVYRRSDEASHPRLAHLGVEPLEDEFNVAHMMTLAGKTRRPIKNFIMDATKVVGVGNIYASEALFVAGIHPKRAAGRISKERWQALVAAVKSVLEDAICNGGTTLRDFVDGEGTSGSYGGRLRAYGREGERCQRIDCGTIRRTVMVGRSTYYCPRCQR